MHVCMYACMHACRDVCMSVCMYMPLNLEVQAGNRGLGRIALSVSREDLIRLALRTQNRGLREKVI